jgi:hypothetical protein
VQFLAASCDPELIWNWARTTMYVTMDDINCKDEQIITISQTLSEKKITKFS